MNSFLRSNRKISELGPPLFKKAGSAPGNHLSVSSQIHSNKLFKVQWLYKPVYEFFYKKPVYKKLYSNWPLNPRNQSSEPNFFKKLKKRFCVHCRSESSFSLRKTQNICFYTLITKKNIKFSSQLFCKAIL